MALEIKEFVGHQAKQVKEPTKKQPVKKDKKTKDK